MKNKRIFIRRNWIWIAIVFLIVAWVLIFIFNWYMDSDYEPKVCGGDQCFTVELAKTPAEQQKGLMFRTFMEEDDGMLFIFSESKQHNFWMKNTLIPLDMLRIDEQFKVVHIVTAQPCTEDLCPIYAPGTSARYVLEINAGLAAKYRITEGTKMKFMNIQ